MKHVLKLVLSIAVLAAVAVGPVSPACGEEDKVLNPWERDQPATSSKKPDKERVSRKAKPTSRDAAKQMNKKKVKKASRGKARKAQVAKAEKKDTEQKKIYILVAKPDLFTRIKKPAKDFTPLPAFDVFASRGCRLLLSPFSSHICRHFLYFRKIPLHLTPPIPEGIIGIRMESTLEGSHSVFEEHNKELLLNHARSIMKREQVGERVCIGLGLFQETVLVKARHGMNCLCHQTIRILDHLVAFLQFGPGEIYRMALMAGI